MNTITFPLKLQMKSPAVADLQEALVFLGFPIIDAEKTNQRYGTSTRAAVLQFQTAHKLTATGEVDEATANAVNGVLAAQGAFDPVPADIPGPAGPQVTGTVLHADGSAIGAILIEAFHRRVGGEDPLGQTATNERGQYTVTYPLPAGLSKIDLFVRAYDDQYAIVAVSPIIIGAGEQESLDLTVSDTRFRGASEFARATAALAALVAGATLDELDANDVALLVRNTGISRERVTAWIASLRLASRTGIEHESLYALVRSENIAALPRLLRRSASRLLGTLSNAAESNLISFAAGQQAQDTVAQLRKLAVELSSSTQTPGSLGQLLATCISATPAQQAGFVERYANHEGPVQDLWASLRKDPAVGDVVVNDLQLSLQLGTLAANHPPLVKALRSSGVHHAAQTATLDTEGWRGLLQTEVDGQAVGTPANIKGTTDAERQDNYIKLLQERTARAFPTAHVAKTLKTLPTWQSSSAVSFLDLNPDFNVLTANIKSSLDAGAFLMRPDWDRAKLEADLNTVQRVARVAPRGMEENVVNGLLGNGYTSALGISRQSRASFRRRTAAAFGDEATADAVHRNAHFQVARAGSAYALMHPRLGGGFIDAIGGISDRVASDPTWASLFGNVDYCSCDHCQSIYGPAAYLVDLLAWLDGHDLTGHNPDNKTAFDRLNARRPDIQRIELSCDNTNTVLPYVDLVNEILEVLVLNPPGGRPGGPAAPQATTATSPELLANPEYLYPQAYDHYLAKAVFPTLLPFDLWGALGRVYFEHLGVRRADLMEALQRQDTPSGEAIDAERLQLSTVQWEIVSGAAHHGTWAYWGYPAAKQDGRDYKLDLAVVSNFLDRAGIDYDDLLDLLHSRFANPGGIAISGADCNTDEMTIGPLKDKALAGMQRFLRLWRNRAWSMLELDKVLFALNITTLNGAALAQLADLDRVQALTRAPLLEVLSWWATMDTYADRAEKAVPIKSLYDRVYLNRAVDTTAEEPTFPLALSEDRSELASTTVTWDAIRSILQAALSIDADDLALMLDESVDGLPNAQRVVTGATVTLDGLSALYRHVSLARRLKLRVSELLALLRLVGFDPFDIATTDAMLAFIETAARIRISGFSLLELQYLLAHDAQAESVVGVTDEAIGQTLVELRDGLARVAADYAVTADPVGKLTAQYLAVVLNADAVAAVMTALQTTADASNNADLEAVLTDKLGNLISFDAVELIGYAVEDRFNAMVALLAPYLQESQGNALIIEKMASFASLGLDSMQDLLALRLQMTVNGKPTPAIAGLRTSPYTNITADEIVPTDDLEAFAALRRIYKAALLLNKLEIEMDAQAWLFDAGVGNGLFDPLSLPIQMTAVTPDTWNAWTRLLDMAALAKDIPGGEPNLAELLQLLESSDDVAVAEEAFLAALAARTGWLRADLDNLRLAFAATFPADWRDGSMLRKCVDAFALIKRLGVSAARARSWAEADIDAAQAEELRLAAKAKHDEERWPAIARALRDPVREMQRAALVAYLIARDDKYADDQDLYADMLIDVDMAPCMLTSRIKQAISSVQLFVQRAFLNLEDGIELTRDDRDQWEWMKTYRVWEAARKVFLYPENWIEPELRLDKSPLFEQLENSLLQGELDDVAAEKAYTEYLEGLLKIARLEVMSLYHQYEEDADGIVDVLHVVARTRASPQEYYYRQWIDAREWTPWEKLDVDMEGNHAILAVHARRLFLFWPMVVQKAEGDGQSTNYFYEIRLAWLERLNAQWGARKLSIGSLTSEDDWHGKWDDSESSIFFRLAPSEGLDVQCVRNDFRDSYTLMGTFNFDSCTGQMLATPSEDVNGDFESRSVLVPLSQQVARMRYESVLDNATMAEENLFTSKVHLFSIETATLDGDEQPTTEPEDVLVLSRRLDRPAAAFSYSYPHQYSDFLSQYGVFLDDDAQTFFVMPESSAELDSLSHPDLVQASNVGATDAGSLSFQPRTNSSPFAPDIEWDQMLAPAAKSAQGGSLKSGGLSGSLSALALGASQVQLDDVNLVSDGLTIPTTTKYRFALFYHPYVCDFMTELRRHGVTGLLDPNPKGSAPTLVRQQESLSSVLDHTYDLTDRVANPDLVQNIDFDIGGAYAKYNWEIFFHVPMLIASRLSQNQRFEEARRWFHFMFDPGNRSADKDPLRFWKIKPFYREPDAPIEDFLALAAAYDQSTEVERAREDYDNEIAAWVDDPFDPHGIAELRTTAYQKTLVMKYLDNLIAWGDQLFRQDTIETVNEATQLYVMALQLLGDRPDALPPRSTPVATTFKDVRSSLDASVLNNPLVHLENLIARPDSRTSPVTATAMAANSWTNLLLPKTNQPTATQDFYFCIPPNDKLLSYWDTVTDRLFKIRHCMNIEGVVRQLPLFEPPIDPGMLVRARAAGIDLSSALADLSAPLPHYRFSVMLQKAYSFNQTVRGLGSALLSAIEKKDAEALAMLRSNQEVALLEAVREVKKLAIDEASHALEAAVKSLTVVQARHDYYQGLISDGNLIEELNQLKSLKRAKSTQLTASSFAFLGTAVAPIPPITTGASGTGGTPVATVTMDQNLAKAFELLGQGAALAAASFSSDASTLGITANFSRRAQEWAYQKLGANHEIKQINSQIDAAKVRVSLAEHDLDNHERQIENARSVREFMEQKFTNVQLYQWMVGQLSSLYFQSYQLAYDLAKQTERAYRHELALPEATFIQFGYWDSLKKGLLAGERLQYDLERMDKAYLQNNQREYEITRHVSLALLDPVALVQLQTAGSCEFSVPEALFDLDYPGHYLRRIKSVSVTVPCVTGPYTSVPMRLTLVSSRTRIDPNASTDYPMDLSMDDMRFQVQTGAVQSIVVSAGREDAGLFSLDHRDERYLPFEGSGAISDWNLTLTSAVPTFDWTTITDVVLHVRYTAREGGDLLREAASKSLNAALAGLPLRRAFSAKSEFPSEWNAFLRPRDGSSQAVLSVVLAEQLFPYIVQGAGMKVTRLELIALVRNPESWQSTEITVATANAAQITTLAGASALYAGLPSGAVEYANGAEPGTWDIAVPMAALGAPSEWAIDLILIATYQVIVPT
jgi:hypothetical protein